MYLLFSPPFFLMIYNIFFYYIHLSLGTSTLEGVFLTVIIITNIFSIVSFLILYIFINKKKAFINKIYIEKKGLSVKIYLIFFLLELTLLHYLLYNVFGAINYTLFFDNVLYFYLQSRSGTAWVYLLIYTLYYVILIDIFFNKFNKYKILIFVVMLIILSFTGGRSNIVVYFGLILFILYFYKDIKIKLRYLILSFILLMSLFISSTINRSGSVEHYMSGLAFITDFDQVRMLNKATDYIDKNGTPYLTTFQDVIYMFIPRSIYPEKPKSTAETRLLYPSTADKGLTNYTIGMYANAYLNSGIFYFLILLMFILLSNYLYIKTLFYKKITFMNFIIIFWLVNYLQFLRAGIINGRVLRVTIFLFVAYLIYKLLTTKFKIGIKQK